ncbi:hypothetical protein F442_00197 [Phytophthora nicotianae P10297]|uniref:Uncharacterized protein n=1 Tax=Phytophthora nicotianae P10297 TaxID=1317064 RepID=W3A7T5_PHYNI|nr:hypothetical protein F442_00197 [Phytophthora nicotianae P10297]
MPNPSDAITISIHCGSGDHATSIILPRHHHLARKLEELVSSGMTTQTQPLAQQPDVIRALSLVVKYINDSRHEGPDSSIAARFVRHHAVESWFVPWTWWRSSLPLYGLLEERSEPQRVLLVAWWRTPL